MSVKNNKLLVNSKKTIDQKGARSLPNLLLSQSQSLISLKKQSFIFFGCWNHIDCTKTYVFRDIILKLLKKKEENSTIIIGGDNWYNQKFMETTKYYPIKVLYTGYKLLFDISKDIYIVLGNHDIDISKDALSDVSVSKNSLIEQYSDNISNRCMLKTQENVINYILNGKDCNKNEKTIYNDLTNYNNKVNFSNSKVSTYLHIFYPKIVKIEKNVYRLYINTNIYDEHSDVIEEYIKYMKALLVKDIKLLFVVGHHPFVGLKLNKEVEDPNGIIEYEQGISDFYMKNSKDDLKKSFAIFKIVELLNKYKTIYLCADIHSFQVCKIHKNVGMVIVGTGGASKDPIIEKTEKRSFNINIDSEKSNKQNIINVTDIYAYNAYGYSKISYDNNYNVYIEYLQIDETLINETSDDHIPYKTYNFKFEYNNDCWNIVNKNKENIKTYMNYYCEGPHPIFVKSDTDFINLKETQLVRLKNKITSKNDIFCYPPSVKQKNFKKNDKDIKD